MITITLPNKDKKQYKKPVTSAEIANDISEKLASDALVSLVNGELWDLDRPIEIDSTISILTKKNKETLDVIRHDAAHIMAEAVLELFPETQVTIGPSIENGFYYDFYREKKFALSDLEVIEKRMHEIVDRDEIISREIWSRENAVNYFKKFVFPYPTLLTNLLGCFLIGLALGWSIKNSNIDSSLVILFTVGFCGGFTTFSSFSQENLTLINNNQLIYLFMFVDEVFLSSINSLLL